MTREREKKTHCFVARIQGSDYLLLVRDNLVRDKLVRGKLDRDKLECDNLFKV